MTGPTLPGEYAGKAVKLLDQESSDWTPEAEAIRGVGYAVLALREDLAAQMPELAEAVGLAVNQGTNLEVAADRVADQAGELAGAIGNLAEIADVASLARRGWLRWLPARRVKVTMPGPGAEELPEQPHPWGVTLTPDETGDVWHALADAASYRLQRLPGESEAACGACAEAAELAAGQHGPDAAAAARCPAHAQDERLLSAYSVLRIRLQGGEPR